MSNVPSFGDRVLVEFEGAEEPILAYRKVKFIDIRGDRIMVLLDEPVEGVPNPIDPIHLTVIASMVLHRDTSGDWAFVTHGDEITYEGHVDDAMEFIIENLVGVRDIDLRESGVSRGYKDRLSNKLDASDVFKIVER